MKLKDVTDEDFALLDKAKGVPLGSMDIVRRLRVESLVNRLNTSGISAKSLARYRNTLDQRDTNG